MKIYLNLIIILSFYACSNPLAEKGRKDCMSLIYNKKDFNLIDLPYDSLPFTGFYTANKFQYDDDSIPLMNIKSTYITPNNFLNNKMVYHPVYSIEIALVKINDYHFAHDTSSLELSDKIAFSLIDKSLKVDDATLIVYSFPYFIHDNAFQEIYSPWYSAMAQGMELSLLSRLYKETNDSVYLEHTGRVFQSFKLLKANEPFHWISCVDEKGFLWLEEYPMDVSCHTLNGMMFAMFGIYEYYELTKDPEAFDILQGSLATIDNYLGDFRNEKDMSYYCLKHKVKDNYYHKIHQRQLKILYRMTGYEKFHKYALLLAQDYKE